MSTSARRKRSRRFYWAEIGFLVLGLIALKPEILTELIPTGSNSSQLASQAALNQALLNTAVLNNAGLSNAALGAGGNAVFVPVPGTLLYPANYATPSMFASIPSGMQTTQPATYMTASYSAPYIASSGMAPSYPHSAQPNSLATQAGGWGQPGGWSSTYAHSPSQPLNPSQNVTSMMASTSPTGLQVVWPDSYRPIASQTPPSYLASNSYLSSPSGNPQNGAGQYAATQYAATQYGTPSYGNVPYSGTPNVPTRGTLSTGINVANAYGSGGANPVAAGAYPQYNYPQGTTMQGTYPGTVGASSGYVPNSYSTMNNATNTMGGYRNTLPSTTPPVVGRY